MTVKVIPLDLPADHVELALVALYALDKVHTGTPLPAEQLIAEALRFFDTRHALDLGRIGELCDALFEPLYDSRLTPAERLLMLDTDTDDLSDEEAAAILHDMDASHGPVTPDDLGRAFAS